MRPQDPNIGRDILGGQFQILQKIGSGGMGSVYKAAQPAMNRMVAVKILHPKLANRKDLVSRFRREARAMSHLTHPNTVKVLLYGELEDGSLYIVMEYLEGKNLNQIVRKEGPMGLDRAIPVLIQVCGALQEAHSQGIVHRDLKPENIFLSTNGGLRDFPKVLDFGLAKVTERELRPGSVMLTQEGMVFGTPEFMSPEQAQGKPLDARSDIYSLAVILYEMLTGKLPFDARTPMEFIQHHVTKPPLALETRVPGKTFPQGLGAVIAKALEKRPEDRYTTAADFADALKPYAPGGGKGFSGLFPASSVEVLEKASRSHAELAHVPEQKPESQRQPPPAPAPTPSSSRQGGGASAPTAMDGAPSNRKPNGANPMTSTGNPLSSPRPMPSPHAMRPATKSGTNEGPSSLRIAPPVSRPAPAPAPVVVKGSPSTLTLVGVAVGFLIVGVLLAVIVLKLLR
ncbi:serine/threonine-protein kinase [Polyangium mundeleinium]|uniref:Serine/threonine-protein kinase n=1 Tax=Polyangium mundeleinium TaxID=2995306 RepID=A0ABT5F3R5_9BACT|nr:serine/threonine-protein kinase [Polyangium mundeleinium]MDC0748744.1 serine/threonine-protein kinase [Polyangium mundeleinium]